MSRLLALLVALCGCLVAAAHAMQPPACQVLDYATQVEVEADGNIIVTEDITLDILREGSGHGLRRRIPVNPRWRDLARQKVRLDLLEASIDGRACPPREPEHDYPNATITLRDDTRPLAAGPHRFHLRYRMSEQLGFFEAQDELTWNAVGEQWSSGVRAARATFVPPPGAAFTAQRAWLGERGSQDSPVSIRREDQGGREVLVFDAQRPLKAGEALTCAVAWPKGFVSPHATHLPAEQEVSTMLYATCFLLTLGIAYALWVRGGRDPDGGPVIPRYYPPRVPRRLHRAAHEPAGKGKKGKKGIWREAHEEEYMTPAAVQYVHDGGELKARGLAALLLALALRGDCRLGGNAQDGFTITRRANSSPAPEERAVGGKLPRQLRLQPDKRTNNPLGRGWTACKELLERDYPMKVEWNIRPQCWLLLGVLALLAVLIAFQIGNQWSQLVLAELGGLVSGVLLLLGGAVGLWRCCRKVLLLRACPRRLLGMLLLALLCTLSGLGNLLTAELQWLFSPLQQGLMLASMAVPAVFACLMDMPSREQVTLRQEIRGLALYIATAETARFNFANPPEEDLRLYHRLLPYAVALGLEDAWGARFADKLDVALPPELAWTEAAGASAFCRAFVRSADTSLVSYQDAISEARASWQDSGGSLPGSSSFEGGGGAGLGGGGGGGDIDI